MSTTPIELLTGGALVLILLAVAGYFGWRQIQASATLRRDQSIPTEERTFIRRQVRRRLVCCVLMIVFAALLVGWFVIESQLPEFLPQNPDEKPRENPWVETIIMYWTFALLVLFAMLTLAGIDLIATARFGFRSHRLLEIERKAVLEAEAARLRRRRAEKNGD